MSRYDSRKKAINKNEMYENIFEDRGITEVLQYTTARLKYPSETMLERMRTEAIIEFTSLFDSKEGKIGVVVTFLAILELLKDSLIEIVQSEEFGPIHIKGIEEVH